jgi:hypothetical protein
MASKIKSFFLNCGPQNFDDEVPSVEGWGDDEDFEEIVIFFARLVCERF